MKWPFTSILAFGCLSLASSVPLILDDTAMMYPAYPYLQDNYVNFDFGKFFRKAASSMKHFYSYMNEWIFGRNNKDPNSAGYHFWKQHHANATLQPAPLNPSRVHIEAYKVFKDANGRVVVKNIPNIANLNLPLFAQNSLNKIPMPENALDLINKIRGIGVPGLIGPIVLDDNFNPVLGHMNKVVKKDNPEGQINLNNLVMNNPFRWNEKLAKDQMLGKANPGMMIHPVVVRIEGEMLPGGLGYPLNEFQSDDILQKIIHQQSSHLQSNQAPNQPQANEPHPDEKIQPQLTETTSAPNQPAAESDKKQTQQKDEIVSETTAAQEKPDDQEDDDEESDDEQNDDNEQAQATETPKNEPSTEQAKQPKDVGNQGKANTVKTQAPNTSKNNDNQRQQLSGQGKSYIRVGNQDVSLDTAQKVLEMVQAHGNGNNQNDPFANIGW